MMGNYGVTRGITPQMYHGYRSVPDSQMTRDENISRQPSDSSAC